VRNIVETTKSAIGAVALALLMVLGTAVGADVLAKDHVNVGVNLPLSGPIAVVALPYRDGLLMGVEDAAANYKVAANKVELDIQDNAGEAKQAVSVMQKHFLKNVDAYISGLSAQTGAVAPEVDKKSVPHLMVAFEVSLMKSGKDRLRILPHFKIAAPLYVEYAKMRKAKRVAIMSLNWGSLEELHGVVVQPELEKAGIVVMREMFDIGTKDYNTLALKVAQFKPDLVIVDGLSFNIYPMLNALRALGLAKDGAAIAGMDFIDLIYKGTPTQEIAGVAFISPHFDLPSGQQRAHAWIERFKAKFGKEPSYMGAYGYDTARILVAAFAKNGDVSPKSIRSVLPFEGIVGTINLDADGDLTGTLGIGIVDADRKVNVIKQ
jgi:branched-chain amino acid transport system substrate-binding protein